ncbi:NAD(P)H-hydrate dehydratase [Nitrosomonas supralitoralis]|uniref:Bifunctional NAD(P)H-hydrate repair enzyme n=1 Tax=Nitrosomonas supralitoralis TaxID=2116706 RepID=A0A2P7NVF3_9PROT|nr:NAD(P)H-hydrate dehydratase [Nitrosomonas supralitoralis]PSJ17446.1 bifunctional ADP-dependent NAD(P)H-hydrate dehydratase/NAD(P)H-hydrate epimerase [Nitrosomonas supralitoralis]
MLTAEPIFLTAEIREIEHLITLLPTPPRLMEKAGLAAAQIVRDQLHKNPNYHILVLAGPGNNGGDAFVVARHMKEWGNAVTVVFNGDLNRVPPDAKQAIQAWLDIGGEVLADIPDGDQNWDTVIDGLFGIGLDQSRGRPIEGKYREWVDTVNRMNAPIVSLDIPSGLGSDDGCIYGTAIRATTTVTFIGLKPGLFTNFGPECCGTIVLRDLNILLPSPPEPHVWLLNQNLAQSLLPPPRPVNSHKGSFGNVAILGGSTGMVGAALLAGRTALYLGAGRVYLGLLAESVPPVDFSQPELMLRHPSELFTLESLNCLIIGPGLGQSKEALSWLEHALNDEHVLVLDADALNLIAQHQHLAQRLSQRNASTILTPHPAEAARLLYTDTATVQNDRMNAAYQISQQFNCHIVLKGAGSICCFPEGKRFLNTSGNPGLSTAGTGDVLTGIIGALIAQDLNPRQALMLAVYLHGAAADHLLQQNQGPLGMVASEIINMARLLLNKWIYQKKKTLS